MQLLFLYMDAIFDVVDNVVVDTDFALKESGDLLKPVEKGLLKPEEVIRLGEVISGKVAIDAHAATFFKSVGMALLDLFTARKVYEKAMEKNIGTQIDF